MSFTIPPEIINWISSIFADCNERLSEKISNNPNTPETSLDVTLIEHLSRYASPITFGSRWTVRIDTHFIGGRRHFFGWEVADIGLLVFFRQHGVLVRKKVALLQAKRLYPTKGTVQEETREDILIGLSTLFPKEPQSVPISQSFKYEFKTNSRYKAFKYGDNQYNTINKWNIENKVPVYYLFYNPWTLPFDQIVPLRKFQKPAGTCELGTRVIPAKRLFQSLKGKGKNYSPTIGDLEEILPKPHTWATNAFGWRLEAFFKYLLDCKEGYPFETDRDVNIDRLFYRKDAMLSAAIAINIELND